MAGGRDYPTMCKYLGSYKPSIALRLICSTLVSTFHMPWERQEGWIAGVWAVATLAYPLIPISCLGPLPGTIGMPSYVHVPLTPKGI